MTVTGRTAVGTRTSSTSAASSSSTTTTAHHHSHHHQAHPEQRKKTMNPTLCHRKQESSRQAIWQSLLDLFRDLYTTRGSIVLLMVFWPIAFFQMFHAWIQRMFTIGLTQKNVASLIPSGAYDEKNKKKSEGDNNHNNDESSTIHSSAMDTGCEEDYLLLSGYQLARMIKDPSHPLTSVALTKLCIRQIERLNPLLNAVVATRFEEALQEAMKADEAVRTETIPSSSNTNHDEDDLLNVFWGVPILVKECFEVQGMPFTSGVVSRKHIFGQSTAPAIQEVERSGAIVLAVTNTSEGCMWHESINCLYGRTYNPYDLGRTCGGSSGGCGAGVASCMTPMAVTSDVGGSTRIPAHYNGVFGHKPTGGTVSNASCFPDCGDGKVKNYCQLGPTSKHAEDLWPLLLALSRSQGHPTNDESNDNKNEERLVLKTYSLSAVKNVSIPNLHIYYSTETLANPWLVSKMHPEIPTRIHQVSNYLTTLGCKVTAFPTSTLIPELFQLLTTFQIWSLLLHEGKEESFKDVIRNQTTSFSSNSMFQGSHLLWELFLSIFDCSDSHTFPAMLLALFEYTVDITPSSMNDSTRNLSKKIRHRLEEFLSGNNVWIMPNLPTPAPHHNESTLRIFDVSNTGFFNVMELPVTAIPVGLTTDQGVPIGLQVISGRGQDHLCIAVAKALQEGGLAGWKPPKK